MGDVLDSHSAADRSAQRHDRGRTGINQALGKHNVIRSIGKNREAFLDQNSRGFECGLHIGIKCGLIADYFQLDPVG